MAHRSSLELPKMILMLLLVPCAFINLAHCLNLRPIIGVVAQHTDSSTHTNSRYGDSYIYGSYFDYVQMAGARAVPVLTHQSEDYYRNLFKKLNGVLFPGGGVDLQTSSYSQIGRYMYAWSLEAYEQGDYFPVWGTCEGFELLSVITAKKNLLSSCNGENMTLPLQFTDAAASSRMYGTLPKHLWNSLKSKPLTQNNHQFCVLNSTFYSNQQLSSTYNVLSTNTDPTGKVYISSMEAKKAPIYAVQYHPEKNIFLWNEKANVEHRLEAVQFTQYLADFFVNEARKSSHCFESTQEEAAAVIDNYSPVYFRDGTFYSVYFFNNTQIEF